MTIEELQSEKDLLEERIKNAMVSFHEATGFEVSGKFSIDKQLVTGGWYNKRFKCCVFKTNPIVIINPIEI